MFSVFHLHAKSKQAKAPWKFRDLASVDVDPGDVAKKMKMMKTNIKGEDIRHQIILNEPKESSRRGMIAVSNSSTPEWRYHLGLPADYLGSKPP